MMKKLLLMFAVAGLATMTSCDPAGGNGPADDEQITLNNPAEENQTAFADEETSGGVTFTAKSDWTATVTEGGSSRASASGVAWLRLMFGGTEKYNGTAGTFTLTVELDENYTGSTRSATITLRSGDTVITITIIQDGKTEEGVVPEPPGPQPVAVTGVTLDKTSLELNEGETATLKATVAPENATDKTVTWSSDKPDIADVDNAGKVTAKKAGSATITVTTVDGAKTASCAVTVKKVTTVSKRITRIVELDDSEPETTTYTYDSQGRVIKAEKGYGEYTWLTQFNWGSGKVTIQYGDNTDYTDELILDSNGRAVEHITDNGDPGKTTLTYNGGNLAAVNYEPEDGGDRWAVFNCTWSGGNLTGIEVANSDSSWSQEATYTTHPNDYSIDLNYVVYGMYIDLWDSELYLTNALGNRDANLIATYHESGDNSDYRTTFSYEFDNDGRVTRITERMEGERDRVLEIYYE